MSLEKLMPHIENDLFPGKPISTLKQGDGFVTNKLKGDSIQAKFSKQPEVQTIDKNDLRLEVDSEEITYDKQELNYVNYLKQVYGLTVSGEQAPTKNCLALCCEKKMSQEQTLRLTRNTSRS